MIFNGIFAFLQPCWIRLCKHVSNHTFELSVRCTSWIESYMHCFIFNFCWNLVSEYIVSCFLSPVKNELNLKFPVCYIFCFDIFYLGKRITIKPIVKFSTNWEYCVIGTSSESQKFGFWQWGVHIYCQNEVSTTKVFIL